MNQPANQTAASLTKKSLLVKNISLNFVIHGITVLVGILTVPPIIKGLGVERFGVLTIIWVLIGYSSLFDLGLGRALTQIVSKKIGGNQLEAVPSTVWTSLWMMLLLGTLTAFLLIAFGPQLMAYLKISPAFIEESWRSLFLLALAMPFFLVIIALKGVLESFQKFTVISLLRLPVLIFNYIAPLFVLQVTQKLDAVVLYLVIGRIITAVLHVFAVSRVVPDFWARCGFHIPSLKELAKFGGWITVSNVITPMMTYLDRFVISNQLTAAIVAYYATPYDVITKMAIVPQAVMSVMFPAIATQFVTDPARAKGLYFKSIKLIAAILLVPVAVLLVFAHPLIARWINVDFANHSATLAQLLAAGFFLNCINIVAYSTIQSTGRSDITAKVHMIEFPVYMVALYFGVHWFGIIGAPLAFLVRIVLDTLLMHALALNLLNRPLENAAHETAVPTHA